VGGSNVGKYTFEGQNDLERAKGKYPRGVRRC